MILIYIAILALFIISLLAARNYGYKHGYLEGYQQAKDEEAEEALLRAIELKSDESQVKVFLGNLYFLKAKALLQDDRINEALEKLKASYSYNPDYSYTSYLLGYAYHKKENREESIKYFEAFLQMEPNAPQASQVREILESLKK